MTAVTTVVLATPTDMARWSDAHRRDGDTIALVPTMGALHLGHVALIEHARQLAERVVVSIFVNPLQFDRPDDFEHYPRPIDSDLDVLSDLGVDAAYVPTAAAMYPSGFHTTVTVGGLTTVMEGASRPGHFDGVSTVVTKLFAAVRPQFAVFGEKDFQQLAIVRRFSTDLDLGVEVVGHPTVREPDGLALSSRNTRLSPPERDAAAAVPRALDAAIAAANAGESDPVRIVAQALRILDGEPLARVDYVELFDAIDLTPVDDLRTHPRNRVRIAAAVFFGEVRLIDNRAVFES